MTCDQFDDLWQRLDSVSGNLMDVATVAEVVAVRKHYGECPRCRRKCQERHVAIAYRSMVDPTYAADMEQQRREITRRIIEQVAYDEELQ